MLKFKTHMITPPKAAYVEPSTGHRVEWLSSIDDVFDEVATWRKAHDIPMMEGWKEEIEHQMAMTLKVDNPHDWIYDTEEPYIPRLVAYGRAMWAELHARALAYPEEPDDHHKAAEAQWFASWVARIPSSTCACAYTWHKLGLTPDFSSRSAYYQSTVSMHDAVRVKLGQPLMDGPWRHAVSLETA